MKIHKTSAQEKSYKIPMPALKSEISLRIYAVINEHVRV